MSKQYQISDSTGTILNNCIFAWSKSSAIKIFLRMEEISYSKFIDNGNAFAIDEKIFVVNVVS